MKILIYLGLVLTLVNFNQSIFQSDEESIKKCFGKIKTTPCNETSYFYLHATGKCHQTKEGQCIKSSNSFDNIGECEKTCVEKITDLKKSCSNTRFDQIPKTEPSPTCLALIEVWIYNDEKKECEEAIYSGCGDEKYDNMYHDEKTCKRLCIQ